MSLIPRPYQKDAVQSIFDYYANGGQGNCLIGLPTGCHAKGTRVLMYDGRAVRVEAVWPGDLLMGPDSKPRRVLSLARGRDTMVKITPVKGASFVVNLNHILSLVTTNEGKKYNCNTTGKEIVNISVKDYLTKSKYFKHLHKLYRAECIEFPPTAQPILNPWFIGVMIGDGSMTNTPQITNMDEDVISKCCGYAESLGLTISVAQKPNNRAASYKFINGKGRVNPLSEKLKEIGMWGKIDYQKSIPDMYKLGSVETRKALLAGLIDSDGYITGACVDYVTKSEQLSKDIAFLCRSLGLAAYIAPCKKCCQNGFIGDYFRISISGDMSSIPTVRTHVKLEARKQKKRVSVIGFQIKILPEDDYYGFRLDEDHLYLTEDFTVHHNSGKSLLPAMFIKEVMGVWPNQRFLLITHNRKLISQNYSKMLELWSNAPIGVYSAGLKRKENIFPIVYGGIGSMYKKAEIFGHRDLIFIDECHLISPEEDTMYQRFFSDMKLINPSMKIVGLSATLFRPKIGRLDDGKLFHGVAYDATSYQKFNELMDAGYLCPIIGRPTNIKVDLSKVAVRNGEFIPGELETAVNAITREGLAEFVQLAHDRNRWLMFAGGIDNAEFMASVLNDMGYPSAAIHSKLSNDEIDRRLAAHRKGELRAVTNFNQLTTGYDDPEIDAIGMFRATMSPNLHCQMAGRLLRPHPSKKNALYADYGRNIERLGPINDIRIPQRKDKGGNGEIPIKICDNCGVYNHISARVCQSCGEAFSFEVKITKEAKATEVLRIDEEPRVESFPVSSVVYSTYTKDGNKGLKVSYTSGIRTFSEYVPIGNPKGRKFALDWWRQRNEYDMPDDVELIREWSGLLRVPTGLKVWVNNRYNGKISPKIRGYEW